MKKKQLITLIIMLAVIAGLAVGYVVMKDYNAKKSEEESAEEAEKSATIPLYDINTDDIVKISFTNESTTMDMALVNDVWVQDGTNVPMNTENVDAMKSAVDSIEAIKVIVEDAKNLAEYGLDKPLISYTITTSDGTEYSMKLGTKLSVGNGYYALIDTENKVYAVSENYYEPFTKSFNDMIKMEDDINITADNITHVNVSRNDNFEFDAKYMGDDMAASSYYTWNINKPYKDVPADTDSWKTQLANYEAMSYETCVAYDVSDFSQFGLDKPYAELTVDYFNVVGTDDSTDSSEDQSADQSNEDNAAASASPVPEENREDATLKLSIGDKFTENDTDYYYVRPEGSDNVYTMTAETVKGLVDFSAYKMADPCIYSVLIDQLKGYDIEYKGEKHVVERREEAGTDDADSDDKSATDDSTTKSKDSKGTVNTYYVDGKKADETSLLTLYSAAYLLTLSGEADSSKVQSGADAVLTITYHPNDGDDVVVKYLPYDGANFYQVDKNGMNYFLTDKRGIDDIISRYETFIANLK